jgi:transcriptional regulator with XRE-family HTH domain
MLTLEQARTLVKLSQSQLSDASGVKKSSISDIETGRVQPENVSYGTIVRLVRALQRSGLAGVSAEEVFPVADLVTR